MSASGWRQIFRVTCTGGLASHRPQCTWLLCVEWFARSLVAPLLHLDGRVDEVLLVQHGSAELVGAVLTGELPRGDVRVEVVVAQRLAVLGLRLAAEVAAAGLPPVQRVDAHQLPEPEEVRNPAGL